MDDETRAAFAGLRAAFDGLGAAFDGLRRDLTTKIDATAADTRRHFEVVAEGIRSDLKAVIEGLDVNGKKIAANTHSIEVLRDQMNIRFARVRVDLSEIQRARSTRRRPGR